MLQPLISDRWRTAPPPALRGSAERESRRPSVPGPRRRTCGGAPERQRSEGLAVHGREVFLQLADKELVFSGLAGSCNEWILKLQYRIAAIYGDFETISTAE